MDANWAPGNMGPPPMAGPGTMRGNRPGFQGMPGPKPMKKQGSGRVVHILDFERRDNVKTKMLKLLEPFGMVTNSLILNTRNEAFIEMSTQAQAMAAVKYFETNPARLYGKPVKVLLSVKYKSIKIPKDLSDDHAQEKVPKNPLKPGLKKPVKPGAKPTSIEGIGRVLRICNLPITGFPDRAVVGLAEKFGTVKNYILMRKLRQAFVEMENVEDAKSMVDSSTETPLIFKGKPLKILISQKYKTLVLRMPNPTDKKSKQGKSGKKKVKTDTSDITTEEDLTGSCDPEEGEEAAAVEDDQNQNDASKDQSETAPADMEDFVTLDEVGNDAIKKQNSAEQPVEEMEITEELGPYQPNVPVGVSYVMAKTGYYCKLCSLFYTSEEMAKVKHCSSLAHYQKLKEIMDKSSPVITPEPETEQEP